MNSITILDENDKSELNHNISTKSPKLHTHTINDIEGIFTVASGGTGMGSLDANKVLYAASDSAIGQMSIPTAKSILMQNDSGAPYWKPSSDVSYSSKSTITLNGYSGTKYTVTNNGDETYSGTIWSSETATVKVNGLGVYTINYTYAGKTEAKTITINTIGTYSVDCYAAIFNTATYSEISTAAKNGTAASMWSLGDAKAVTLNGTVGAYTFSNETVYMFIMAFDHNSSVEMSGAHHMICSFAKLGLTDSTDMAFVDSHYENRTSDVCFHMNASMENSGGWASSYMRNTICSQFKNVMPSDLQNILRSRTIYTDNTANDGDYASYVTTTTDTVYLPAEFEVQGEKHFANSAEQNYQQQFAYYKNGAQKGRVKSTIRYQAAQWWLRSPCSTLFYSFCSMMSMSGNYNQQYSDTALGFAPLITL